MKQWFELKILKTFILKLEFGQMGYSDFLQGNSVDPTN